jgi:hypothetical protein
MHGTVLPHCAEDEHLRRASDSAWWEIQQPADQRVRVGIGHRQLCG